MEGARPSGHVRSSFHMHMALEHTVMVGLRRCIELIEAVRFLTPICELRPILQHHAFCEMHYWEGTVDTPPVSSGSSFQTSDITHHYARSPSNPTPLHSIDPSLAVLLSLVTYVLVHLVLYAEGEYLTKDESPAKSLFRFNCKLNVVFLCALV
jgi:hypothetical protein